jgi:alpha-N-arabinofuranosidase
MHHYAGNWNNDTGSYLAYGLRLQQHLEAIAAVIRCVKTKTRAKRDVYIAWDEWNVWYRDRDGDGRWQQAPHLLEEVYNLEDALVVAQWLNLFLRRCDVIKIANLAQAVNVIAPILTRQDRLLKQTIFYPLMLYRRHAAGHALDIHVRAPTYDTRQYGPVPLLDASATFNPATGQGAVFLVNRGQNESLTTHLHWHGQAPFRIAQQYTLTGDDPKAANTFDNPDTIRPRTTAGPPIKNARATLPLPPLSLTILATTS